MYLRMNQKCGCGKLVTKADIKKGAVIVRRLNLAIKGVLCPECAQNGSRETIRRVRSNKIGTVHPCDECGKDYTVTSLAQKYCPACRPLINKRQANERRAKFSRKLSRAQEAIA